MKVETKTENEVTLSDLAARLLKVRVEMDLIPKVPENPVKKDAYTIAGWNEYAAEVNELETQRTANNNKHNELTKTLNKVEKLIYKTIPVTLIWFITDDGKYAVGIETSNWGGNNSTICIKENPDIKRYAKTKALTLQLKSLNTP